MRHLDRLADWAARRERASERVLIERGHDAEPRLWRRVGLLWLLGLGALLGHNWLPGPLDAVANAVLGIAVGVAAFRPFNRAGSYRAGWLDGRTRIARAGAESISAPLLAR